MAWRRGALCLLLLLLLAVTAATGLQPDYPELHQKEAGYHSGISKGVVREVESVTFLVTVNDTWWPNEEGGRCMVTVKTPPLQPNKTWNESETIHVGKCDQGPLTYTLTHINPYGQTTNHTYLAVVFYSSVIEDASHPSCTMLWDYSYLTPTTPGTKDSLLPGCFVMDSREGYHMTYYWFHALDWSLR